MTAFPAADVFILSAFDRDQWCPVLEAAFRVDDLEALRMVLGEQAADDPEIRHQYLIDATELDALTTRFGVGFDLSGLQVERPDIFLSRQRSISKAPYLVHTGYELPLMLAGRKKLARMSHVCPPDTFDGEERFDHWTSVGMLSKSEVSEPLDGLGKGKVLRTVYYTTVGDEWRVPAMQLLFKAAEKSGGWNEYFERLEGMLFGYSDAENDWWINVGLNGGGFGGLSACCAVNVAGLAWIEAAGFRALPPSNASSVKMAAYRREAEDELRKLFFGDLEVAAFIRFNILGRYMMNIVDLRTAGPWDVPSDQIPMINQNLRGSVVVVARRDPPSAECLG